MEDEISIDDIKLWTIKALKGFLRGKDLNYPDEKKNNRH